MIFGGKFQIILFYFLFEFFYKKFSGKVFETKKSKRLGIFNLKNYDNIF